MAQYICKGYQMSPYKVLIVIGWSFKVLFGLLSDCVPIYGYRRKSWILIGWTIKMIILSVLAFSPFGGPFCNREKTKYCGTPLEKVPEPELASDAMMVEYAQREPVAIRGRIQKANPSTTRWLASWAT
ncbi:hypothetical protein H257_16044 [Aphanomyces astaci]|uniref:Uncharacterized protein n=1 Tax=Aphanomyces astaci TaxID=112090 RepID=W4FJW8_APHAT|nr:hypothetical protein H257_16044 [Aphanomyces astaci]ETV67807.1 hypothetical protein H257_16044 [Aphanomyces astaci]|eukprot:XP_009842665.1 hypothetical protein H257_16044 [Aphanomyces astaci]